jgi:hypothetical protein
MRILLCRFRHMCAIVQIADELRSLPFSLQNHQYGTFSTWLVCPFTTWWHSQEVSLNPRVGNFDVSPAVANDAGPLERSAAVGGLPKFRDTANGGCAWQKSDRVGQRYPAIERGRNAEKRCRGRHLCTGSSDGEGKIARPFNRASR